MDEHLGIKVSLQLNNVAQQMYNIKYVYYTCILFHLLWSENLPNRIPLSRAIWSHKH